MCESEKYRNIFGEGVFVQLNNYALSVLRAGPLCAEAFRSGVVASLRYPTLLVVSLEVAAIVRGRSSFVLQKIV